MLKINQILKSLGGIATKESKEKITGQWAANVLILEPVRACVAKSFHCQKILLLSPAVGIKGRRQKAIVKHQQLENALLLRYEKSPSHMCLYVKPSMFHRWGNSNP